MYREEISTAWKGQQNSIHLWKCSLQYKLQFPYPLLPLPPNEFHRSMEWFPWVRGMISTGTWNYCHGPMKRFPWLHGIISLGLWKHFSGLKGTTLLNKIKLIYLCVSWCSWLSVRAVIRRSKVLIYITWFCVTADKMFSIKFPLVYGKIIRENSLRYKNVTATYHRYQGIVPYLFCSVPVFGVFWCILAGWVPTFLWLINKIAA